MREPIFVLEDAFKQAFAQQMLDEHLFDLLVLDIGIERALTNGVKLGERDLKFGLRAFFLNLAMERRCEGRHLLEEIAHRRFKANAVSLGIAEEAVEQFSDISSHGEVELADLLIVLPEKRALRVLENGIFGGIADGAFLLDLDFEHVAFVLGLPEAERKRIIGGLDCAINFLAMPTGHSGTS